MTRGRPRDPATAAVIIAASCACDPFPVAVVISICSGGNPMTLRVIIARSGAGVIRCDPAALRVVIAVWRAFDPLTVAVIIASSAVAVGRADVPAALIVIMAIGIIATLLTCAGRNPTATRVVIAFCSSSFPASVAVIITGLWVADPVTV